jgi:hypothetical protein
MTRTPVSPKGSFSSAPKNTLSVQIKKILLILPIGVLWNNILKIFV